MNNRKVWIIIGILVIISCAGTTISLFQMYRIALSEEATRLSQMLAANVTLIEAVARFDRQHSNDVSGGAAAATMHQVVDGLSRMKGFGRSGEFIIGRKKGQQIEFVYSDRQEQWRRPEFLSNDRLDTARPMLAALDGKTGLLSGLDYRNTKVLAAYAPITGLNVGVVAKIDLAEIQRPFIETALTAILISLALVSLGGFAILRLTDPLISQYRNQADMLKEEQLRIQSIIDTAVEGIITIDSNGVIESFNPAAEKIFGYGQSEVLGKKVNMLQPEPIRTEHDQYLHRYLQTGEKHIIGIGREVPGRHKSGRPVPLHLSVSEVKHENRRFFTGILRDISKEKESEEQLKQAIKRAETADNLKSAFLASMSHEIRTPLNSIIGFTGIILQKIVGPLNEEQSKQLTMVQSSANHLLCLINDILDLSKIEAGQLTVEKKAFHYKDCIDMVTASLSPLAEKKGLQLLVDDIHFDISVIGDRRRVEQVLINIINNAIKFTEKGAITISFDLGEEILSTVVTDTGLGLASHDLGQIFTKFRQLETSLARKYEGTGLGLSISKSLVEMMGGKIWAHSDGRGRGSSFTFTLPVANKEKHIGPQGIDHRG